MSRGSNPQLALDHQALARDLLAGYSLLIEQAHADAPHEQLRRFCLHLGYHLEHLCKRQLGVRRFTREQFAEVAAELVRVFGGRCEVVTSGSTPIVLRASEWSAPASALDAPHPSLLVPEIMAEVAARNFGYGKVSLRETSQGGYELRAYLKETRHARLDHGVEYTPESLPDPGELEHELIHQFERVRALRDALRHTEQRFAALASQAPDGILSLDLEGRCTYANHAAGLLLGYRAGELVGQQLSTVATPESLPSISREFDLARAGKQTDLIRIGVVMRDGRALRLSMRMWPQRVRGRVVGVDLLARDVTDREHSETALRESESLYRTLVEMSPDAIFKLDAAGAITFVNEFALRIIGYPSAELLGAHFGKLLPPESRESGRMLFERAMAPGAEPGVHPLALAAKDGRLLHSEISLAQVRSGDQSVGLMGVARDVTQRREIEEELFQQHRALSALNVIANVVSRSLDLKHTLRQALDKVVEVTEFEGGAIFLRDEGSDHLHLAAALGIAEPFVAELAVLPVADSVSGRAVLSGETLVVDDLAATSGSTAALSTRMGLRTYVAVPLAAQQQVLGVMGLGARKRLRVSQELVDLLAGVGSQVGIAIQNARLFEQTQWQARTDGLTGLYNRQYLEEMFEREVERAQRCSHSIAVMMLDVDGLKKINDSRGHRAGDEILRALGEVIRKSVRGYDIAARYGGDEFVVVLPETDAAGAEAVAGRLRENLEAYNRTADPVTPLRISIGVAAGGSNFDRLLDEADRAMYASRKGRVRAPA